jgi:PAS domain S-box-containing protein
VSEALRVRKEAEDDRRRSEWRLRCATESAGLTYVEVDVVRGEAWAAENFAAVMGFVPAPEQEKDASAGARLLLAHVVPEDRARVAAAQKEFLAGTAAGKLDYRVVGDDHVERWIETRWFVEFSLEGTPLKSFATNLDITERKFAEQRVHESEERYRDLFESIDEGFCVIEMIFDERRKPVDWRYLEVNPSFEKHSGMHNVAGKRASQLLPEIEAHLEMYGNVALTGAPVRLVTEVKTLDRWIDLYAFRIGRPEKRKVAVLFNDITERKWAEIALHESEERYRTLLGSIDEAFCIIEIIVDDNERPVDYLFLEVNSTFEKQTGLVEATGKRMRELVPSLEAHWFEIYGKVARTGESIRFVNVAKDMGGRWFDVYACRVGGPSSRKVALVFNDITKRKQVEEALRAGEQRLRFVMDSMPQKVVTARADGVVDYFNPQWTEFTGLPLEELSDGGWTQFIHPDDLAETQRLWQHSTKAGEVSLREHRFRRADGEYRWHLSRTVPMRDAAGKLVLWIGSSTDVHEVKEADHRKDEFLAMLAHELRNPLAPIRNMLEVMKRADGREVAPPALRMMDRQVRHMTRLIDDLLDASRISQGKIGLQREKVELFDVVRQAVEASRPYYEAANQELTIALPAQPVFVDADGVRLAQLFGNLLHNASKFSPRGGRVVLVGELAGDDAVVSLRDFGIGIAPVLLPRVFDLFVQGDQTLERTHRGLGIGLTLVRRLVEMHGGSVQAASEGVDRGSEFVVRLPVLLEKPEVSSPNSIAEGPTTSSNGRILVVDDNHDSAETLAMLFELIGYQTQLAFDGLEAVEAAKSFRPDVILMDLGMPKLNGFDAARQIRQQPWGEGVVLVALTGWGEAGDRKKTAEAGFDGHLVKPVEFAALTTLLAEFPIASRTRDGIR